MRPDWLSRALPWRKRRSTASLSVNMYVAMNLPLCGGEPAYCVAAASGDAGAAEEV